jgi:hypothetical protein
MTVLRLMTSSKRKKVPGWESRKTLVSASVGSPTRAACCSPGPTVGVTVSNSFPMIAER